jgi:hypothetical protein
MSQQQGSDLELTQNPKKQTPKRKAIQQIANAVGLNIVRERMYFEMPGTVGIWHWVDATLKEIDRLKGWLYGKTDIETVRRLIAYLADPNEVDNGVPRLKDDPPMWEHLLLKYADTDPRTQTTRVQSTYRRVSA